MAYEWSVDELKKLAQREPMACPMGREAEWLHQFGAGAMEARNRLDAGDVDGDFGAMVHLRDQLARKAHLMRRVAKTRGRLDE